MVLQSFYCSCHISNKPCRWLKCSDWSHGSGMMRHFSTAHLPTCHLSSADVCRNVALWTSILGATIVKHFYLECISEIDKYHPLELTGIVCRLCCVSLPQYHSWQIPTRLWPLINSPSHLPAQPAHSARWPRLYRFRKIFPQSMHEIFGKIFLLSDVRVVHVLRITGLPNFYLP